MCSCIVLNIWKNRIAAYDNRTVCNVLYRMEDQLLEDVSGQRLWMRKDVVMGKDVFNE
ncbi:hypothetical protein DSM16313_24070 [Acinetobacter seohaensis]|nr:hypothetical protein DSM16313_24070 [Acinetobacter seohaensis]